MRRNERGFTLVEIMVVVVILGILAAIVITQLPDPNQAKADLTPSIILELSGSVDRFKLDWDVYPEKLEDLMFQPPYINTERRQWIAYLKKKPRDGWGNEFIYRVPGTNGQLYDIVSLGSDHREGGQGYAADIWNHEAWKR